MCKNVHDPRTYKSMQQMAPHIKCGVNQTSIYKLGLLRHRQKCQMFLRTTMMFYITGTLHDKQMHIGLH